MKIPIQLIHKSIVRSLHQEIILLLNRVVKMRRRPSQSPSILSTATATFYQVKKKLKEKKYKIITVGLFVGAL